MTTAHLLFNPASGSFSPARAEQVQHLLRQAGISCTALFPGSAAEAAAIIGQVTREAAEPLVIAVGGDGTVNTALNGIANPRTILGYIPLGTANVLAHELKLPSPAAAVARIRNGDARPVTVGRISDGSRSHHFLLMTGIGFDGAVVATVRPREKHLLGKGAYLLAALRQFRDWDRSQLAIRIGDETLPCHTVIVCNATHYGGTFRLAPGTSLFAPTFQVVGVTGPGRKDFTLWALKVIFSGGLPRGQAAWTRQTDQVEIIGNKAMQVDGDAAGRSPVVITALPGYLRLLV
jgi:diacylglycerol kinase family enzyme